jgi:hypothetical protein
MKGFVPFSVFAYVMAVLAAPYAAPIYSDCREAE